MNERAMELFQSSQKSYDPASLFIFLAVVAGIVLIFIIVNYIRKRFNLYSSEKAHSNVKKKDFFSLAKSIGLNSEEMKLLFRLVVRQHVTYPLTCFTNASLLDNILKKGIAEINNNKLLGDSEKNNQIALLLETKAKIETNSKKNTGIRSTHLITENQKIILFLRGSGYFYAIVKRINTNYILIEFISSKITRRILEQNQYLKVYFWRENDAGYTFETTVIGYGDGVRAYCIKHSDKLLRKQKRKYRRIPVNFIGKLYPVTVKTVNNKKICSVDKTMTHCNIMDLSAGGIRIQTNLVEHKDKIVKIEFLLNSKQVNIIGKIIRSKATQEGHIYTIQFLRMSLDHKNIINTYVYHYIPR